MKTLFAILIGVAFGMLTTIILKLLNVGDYVNGVWSGVIGLTVAATFYFNYNKR